jgi:hypothetical protein
MNKDYLISMFIDDELDLDDKVEFVQTVYDDRHFKDETVDLLRQEQAIRGEVVERTPPVELSAKRKTPPFVWKWLAVFASGLAAAMLVFFMSFPDRDREAMSVSHRFIIFQPEADRIEITGSFTGWDALPLKPAGNSGYWEITLDLPEGEHRFSYIVEGGRRLADPTVLTREKDDFGGENSIIEVKFQA